MNQTVGWNRYLWLALLVALLWRLVLAFGVQHIVSIPPARLCLIAGDAEGYWELAGKIVAGQEYSLHEPPRRLLRMPGFPLLLAIPRFAVGDNPFAARLFLVLVGTLACALTYWLGRELAGDFVGIVACAYTALSPTMALYSVLFLSETAFAVTILASLIAATRLVKASSQDAQGTNQVDLKGGKLSLLTGALVGVATYMRPTWLLVGPGLAVFLILFGKGPTLTRLLQALLIGLGLAVTLAPWTYRNFVITGHAITTTLWSGPSLYDGLNPTANGESDMRFFDQENLMSSMSEYEMNREYNRRAWAFAKQNPAKVAWLAWEKQKRYWSPSPNSDQFKRIEIQIVAWAFYIPLIVLAIMGAWTARHDFWLLILTAAPILYFGVLHLLFVGSLRYRLPAEYPLAVLSAIGFSRWQKLQTTSSV